jgi:hypothetical protein
VQVCTLKFGTACVQSGNARKILARGCAHLNLALRGCRVVMHEKYWCADVHTKFSIAQCD